MSNYVALIAAKQKLNYYYGKTYHGHGFPCGTGTLLAPQFEFCAFDDTEYWKYRNGTSKRYCKFLRTSLCNISSRS